MFLNQIIPSKRVLSAIAALVAVGLLSGCATEATSDTYELAVADVQSAQAVRRGAQILIAEPAALKALDSENIVVETAPLTIQYLEGSQWSDRLPRVVQQKLAAAFDGSNRFGGVGLPGQGLAIDYQIITEVRKFGIDASRNTANVQIAVKLLNDRSGNVVGNKTFSASAGAGSGDNDAYIRALNAAFSEVSEEIVVWVTTKI